MRVSHSMLVAWENREFDAAIAMYLNEPRPPVSEVVENAMEDGSALHKAWEVETRATGNLPMIFGGKHLENPEPEVKIVKRLNSWLTLSGVIDLRDGSELYEYKSGRAPARVYAKGHQHGVYQILDPRLTRANYYAFNQHTGEITYEIVHLRPDTIKDTANWIITVSTEMKSTLENLGIDTTSHERQRSNQDEPSN